MTKSKSAGKKSFTIRSRGLRDDGHHRVSAAIVLGDECSHSGLLYSVQPGDEDYWFWSWLMGHPPLSQLTARKSSN